MASPRVSAPLVRAASGVTPVAFVAVDWSGAVAGERRRMWLAEARRDGLRRLECGRDRPELVDHLCDLARREPRLVIGLDFAFSFPRWFLTRLGVDSATAVWNVVDREGESWLRDCPSPFWGRAGRPRPPADPASSPWRDTEGLIARARGIGPKSVFQINGAGSVGTGSLRGMPCLARLRARGFAIWPFDPPRLPLVLEIYPRYLTGPVNKSSAIARALHVQARLPRASRALQDLAASSEDAFDAALSADCMRRFGRDFERLEADASARDRLEGRIWIPKRDPTFERA